MTDKYAAWKLATDTTCNGWCRCPVCDGPAHWSFVSRTHACADPECATQFREHNESAHPALQHPAPSAP